MSYRKFLIFAFMLFAAWMGMVQSGAQSSSTASPPTPQASPTPTPSPKPTQEPITVDDDDIIRVDTELTNILFTATNKQRRLITTLQKEDIRVLEDGKPQEIFTFARQTDLPLSLAILIDTSGSQERTLPYEKEAAAAFVDTVLRAGKDETAVLTFTGEVTLEQDLTGNPSRIRRAIDRVQFTPPSGYIGGGQTTGTPPISGRNQSLAGSTAIWDAIWVTSEEVLSNTSDKTRRAIILLTDGINTSGKITKPDPAIERAIKADAVIYSIGIGDDFYGGVEEGTLKKLSEKTGGRAFFPRNEEDLRKAFEQIQIELRSQYLVAYSPSNQKRDGSYRAIKIEIVNPELRKQEFTLRHRQGYFAKTEEPKKKK
jgi:VWFA-related protein